MAREGNLFRMGEINLNGLRSRKQEFELLLSLDAGKIWALNDTRLNDRTSIEFRNYEIIRDDHVSNSSRAGGVAMLIPKGTSFTRLSAPTEETVAVRLEVLTKDSTRLSITAVTRYLHPHSSLEEGFVDWLEDLDRSGLVIFMGDLNTRCGLVPNEGINKKGLEILQQLDGSHFRLMNDENPTFISNAFESSGGLDLCLIKGGDNYPMLWSTGHSVGSDHLPTELAIDLSLQEKGSKLIEKVNWAAYEKLWSGLSLSSEPKSVSEVDSLIEELERQSMLFKEMATTKRKRYFRGDVMLSKKSRELIDIRRKLLKIRKRDIKEGRDGAFLRGLLNKLNRDIKISIKKDCDAADSIKADDIMGEKNQAARWRKFKDFHCSANLDQGCSFKGIDGNMASTEEEKAKAFADRLKLSHSFPSSVNFDDNFCQEVETRLAEMIPTLQPLQPGDISDESRANLLSQIPLGRITKEEILRNVKSSKKSSAPGEDGITYQMISKGGESFIQILLILYNLLLTIGYYPQAWRSVRCRMIGKPGKKGDVVGNYRPISLSSCLGKLFEKSLKTRLENDIGRNKEENIHQSAYKEGRSCQEHTSRLVQDVYKAFNSKSCVLAVFLDVKGAFDRVWYAGLLHKLNNWGICKPLLRMVFSFISNRKLRVTVGQSTSDLVTMQAGTPQGSVISPWLFNTFVDDLKASIPANVTLAQFADDASIWIESKCPRLAEYHLQEALKGIEKWTSRWRIELEPKKSSCLLFSRCPSQRKMQINLRLHGELIPRESKTRFLGTIVDDRLDWTPQINDLISRTASKINILKNLAAKERWKTPSRSLSFFNSLVGSVVGFVSPNLLAMKSSLWTKLNKIYARTVKSLVGVPNYTSTALVFDHLGVSTWSEDLKKAASKRLNGILTTSPFGRQMKNDALEMRGSYKSPINILVERSDAPPEEE